MNESTADSLVSRKKNKAETLIHPTAIVAKSAKLGSGVEIGPYTIIGPHVTIGRDTRVAGHVVIDGYTTIGERCRIFSGACLGGAPQIKKAPPQRSYLVVGDENIIREYVTMNCAMKEGAATVVGNRNMLMISVHVAHDCVLGNDIVIANSVGLSGHVTVEDHAVIGGLTGIHQFVRVGKFSMVGGVSKVVKDVLPFSIFDGHPACFFGVNSVGLKRAGYSSQEMLLIKKALKIFLKPGLNLTTTANEARKQFQGNKDIEYLISFIENSKRGFSRRSSSRESCEE